MSEPPGMQICDKLPLEVNKLQDCMQQLFPYLSLSEKTNFYTSVRAALLQQASFISADFYAQCQFLHGLCFFLVSESFRGVQMSTSEVVVMCFS